MPPKFSSRLAAFHVDALVFTVVFEALHIQLVQWFPEGIPSWQLWSLWVAVTCLVFVVPTRIYGCTLGKKIYGLKVISSNNVGEEAPPWGALLLREVFFKTLSSFLLGLGFWRARHEPDGKALYDDWTHTQVVSEESWIESAALRVLFEGFVSLLTVVAGVALTLAAMLYTSLPLPVFEQQLKQAGIELGGLRGSLAGGLQIHKFKNAGESAALEFDSLELHLAAFDSWQEKSLVFSRILLTGGTLTFPGETDKAAGATQRFSWRGFTEQLLNTVTDPEHVDSKFLVKKFEVEKFRVKGAGFAPAMLDRLQFEDLRLADGVLAANTFASENDGAKFISQALKFADSRLVISELQGELRPAFLPALQKPLDFSLRGVWDTKSAKDSATKLSGYFLKKTGSFEYTQNKLHITAEKIPVADLFKTQLPFRTVDLNLLSEGKDPHELLLHARASYHAEVCGHQFVAGSTSTVSAPPSGSVWTSPSGPVVLRLLPRNLAALDLAVFDAASTFDSLFEVQIFHAGAAGPAMEQESVAAFCQRSNPGP